METNYESLPEDPQRDEWERLHRMSEILIDWVLRDKELSEPPEWNTETTSEVW